MTIPAGPDVTESLVFTALGDFLTSIFPVDTEVVQGQDNLVPTPLTNNYIVIWPLRRRRLSTNHVAYTPDNPVTPTTVTRAITQPTMFTVQIDMHGPGCSDLCGTFATLWRDSYANEWFATNAVGIKPLYCDDGNQIPWINGQAQYEDCWKVEAHLQINPTVSTSSDFATKIAAGVIEIDADFPPS